jgi:hypothetical protein
MADHVGICGHPDMVCILVPFVPSEMLKVTWRDSNLESSVTHRPTGCRGRRDKPRGHPRTTTNNHDKVLRERKRTGRRRKACPVRGRDKPPVHERTRGGPKRPTTGVGTTPAADPGACASRSSDATFRRSRMVYHQQQRHMPSSPGRQATMRIPTTTRLDILFLLW